MTDEELWEWMQRDLDKDLSLEEQRALYMLLEKEPLLKQKYERLKRVSQQLEQLPSVVPPFPIVDSILPMLKQEAAVPGVQEAESRKTEKTVEVIRISARTDGSAKRSPFFIWMARVGSAAVAACLFFGVLVISQDADRQGENVSHNGANPSAPEADPAAIYGPPVPPPSTNSTPNPTPVEEKKNEEPQPPKQSVQKTVTLPAETTPVAPPESSLGPTQTRPPILPPPPVPREPKPPAFPYGLEEQSDDSDRDDVESEREKKDKDNNGKDKGKEPNGPKEKKKEKDQKKEKEQKKPERDQEISD